MRCVVPAPRAPPAPLLEQPDDVGRVRRERLAGGASAARRGPSRSSSGVPTSRASAVIAADTDGWVTTSSSAAAVTDPLRTTARKLRSWVSSDSHGREP